MLSRRMPYYPRTIVRIPFRCPGQVEQRRHRRDNGVPADAANPLGDTSQIEQRRQGRCMAVAAIPANDVIAIIHKQARSRRGLGGFTAQAAGIAAGRMTLDAQVCHAGRFPGGGALFTVHHRRRDRKNSPHGRVFVSMCEYYPYILTFSAGDSALAAWDDRGQLR